MAKEDILNNDESLRNKKTPQDEITGGIKDDLFEELQHSPEIQNQPNLSTNAVGEFILETHESKLADSKVYFLGSDGKKYPTYLTGFNPKSQQASYSKPELPEGVTLERFVIGSNNLSDPMDLGISLPVPPSI